MFKFKINNYRLICMLLVVGGLSFSLKAQKTIDDKIEELLDRMSIEEKAGQMTQVTIDVVLKDDKVSEIDQDKLKKAIIDYHIGSIINVKEHAYSPETWHSIINQIQELATTKTPNKIPVVYGIDAIHGPNYIEGATLFPHNTGMAATRNTELAFEAAKITAEQTRAMGISWNFDPVLGLGRQPLWSRYEETYGEDVYLVSKMGESTIKGYEHDELTKPTTVASCMKHYLGYSLPASGKDRTPAYIPEYILREYLIPPFKAAVEAGASTVMINSGEINGVPVHASKYYLTDILRGELGFEGVAVSDWEDVIRLHTRHNIAETPKEAVRLAVEAGLDMSMVPFDFSFYTYLVELTKEGAISEARLDESVRRILKLKYDLGLFENPFPDKKLLKTLTPEVYNEKALQAARESMTLLKNENGVLPLPKTARVLLAGPAANNLTSLHSSWSYVWPGNDDSQYPKSTPTIKDVFVKLLGAENVICSSVRDFEANENYDAKKLTTDAKDVDYIILCLGEKAYAEGVGVIDDLKLDDKQQELAQAAIATGKKVILVLAEGRPRVISKIEPGMSGILMAYRPSTMGAQAIADVLFGDYNPGGKLPFTYPKASGDIVLYDYKPTEVFRDAEPNDSGKGAIRPQYPFGYGLSYTTYEYSEPMLSSITLTDAQPVEVSIVVKNTGDMAGQTAVELYSTDLFASVTPSARRLRKFSKVNLKPGESKTVKFLLNAEDLAFVGRDGKWVTEEGDFRLTMGDKMVSIRYSTNTSGTN